MRFEKMQLVIERIVLADNEVPFYVTREENEAGYPVYFLDEDETRVLVYIKELEYPGLKEDLKDITIDIFVNKKNDPKFQDIVERIDDGCLIFFKDEEGVTTFDGREITLTLN